MYMDGFAAGKEQNLEVKMGYTIKLRELVGNNVFEAYERWVDYIVTDKAYDGTLMAFKV